MKKLIVFAFSLLFPFISHSQNLDSLKKYSYFIYGNHSDGSIEQGTAFFVIKDKKTYLVTARHVVSGYDDMKGVMNYDYPDTLYVRVYDINNQPLFITINVKPIKDTIQNKLFYEAPDLFFYKITLPKNIKVNTLENYILDIPVYIPYTENLVSFGYPVKDVDFRATHMLLPPSVAYGKLINDYHHIRMHVDNTIDSLDFPAKYNNEDFHGGFSGCPSYFIYDNRIIFAGVFFAFNKNDKTAFFVRPETVKTLYLSLK